MDRLHAATIRATYIMNELFEAGWNPLNSWSIEDCIPDGFDYASGASRIVVWDNAHPDYVVKLGISEDDDKYSHREVELYEAAVKSGVESQFGWCAYIGEFYGREVYAMEFLECNYDDFEDETYQWGYERYCSEEELDSSLEASRRQYSNAFWGSDLHNDIVLEWFEAQLTKSVAAAFGRFMFEYDIQDIHAGNVARRGTEVVLCDYAGWGW